MITIEAVDQLIERTGVSYKEARDALYACDGDVVDALVYIEDKLAEEARAAIEAEEAAKNAPREPGALKHAAASVVAYVRRRVNEGNVTKIRLKRDEKILLTVPVNVGIIGGLASIAAAPLAVLAAAILAYGLEVKVEIVRADGTAEEFSAADHAGGQDFDAVVEAAEKEAAPAEAMPAEEAAPAEDAQE